MSTRHAPDHHRHLREALAPYLDMRQLRKLAALGDDPHLACRLNVPGDLPPEVKGLLDVLSAILRPTARDSITCPEDVAALMMVEMAALEQEELRVVVLSTKNRLIDVITVYRGTLNSSSVRVAEVFKAAIRRNAASLIVAHNHPSGDPAPSPEDIAVTRELVAAGKLLGVDVLDHLVVGKGCWISLRERGLGFD